MSECRIDSLYRLWTDASSGQIRRKRASERMEVEPTVLIVKR